MTAVVGYVAGDRVYMGADSAATAPDGSQIILASPKVFRVGPMLIGYAGTPLLGQLLNHNLRVPKRSGRKTVDQFMATNFCGALFSTLEGADVGKAGEWQAMIGYSGRLFTVQGDLSILESRAPYAAIGTGADVAMGAIHQAIKRNDSHLSPGELVLEALEAAVALNASCRPPFTTLSL